MKNKQSKGLSLSLSANPKHLIRGAFFAAGKVFADFYEKSNKFYHTLKRSVFRVNRPNLSKSFLTFGASPFVENPGQKIRFKYMETFFWMLGEFASLKSKHDSGVAEANQQNLLNVIANKVKQSFLHRHCEPKARQSFQLHNNRLPRRYAPRNDGNTCGRSMIEMLGVLAIIAVLSVGGLAGYSKAIQTYRLNLQRNTLTELMYNMLKIKSQLNKNAKTINLAEILYAMGETPKSLTYKQNAHSFTDIDGNQIDPQFGLDDTNGGILRYTIYVWLRYHTKNFTTSARNYCYNLALAAQPIADEVIRIYVYYKSNDANKPNGASNQIFTSKNLKNISLAQIHQICDNSLPEDATYATHITIDLNPN